MSKGALCFLLKGQEEKEKVVFTGEDTITRGRKMHVQVTTVIVPL